MNTLNEFEKTLCKSHLRVQFKGKKGRKVPVLFTEEMKKYIDILLEAREEAGVKQTIYFFKAWDI